MNFLARFRPTPIEVEPEIEELPPRRRTFSASQYREEELARAAQVRAAQEAVDIAAAEAAAAGRVLRMAEAQADRMDLGEDGEDGEEEALELVSAEPMDWEEAVGWLSTKSPEARNLIAQNWNWEHDLRVLQFLVAQNDCDRGVATGLFWLTGATDDFFPWGDDNDPADPQFRRAMEMVDALGRRFAANDFTSARFGFDDSWDCSVLKERLEALYLDGRIEWTPGEIETASPGPQPTIDDVPQDERGEVKDFLARHNCA
ncbi:MAG: DUF4274 domain-containing protein [Sphingomicrobium sp.]